MRSPFFHSISKAFSKSTNTAKRCPLFCCCLIMASWSLTIWSTVFRPRRNPVCILALATSLGPFTRLRYRRVEPGHLYRAIRPARRWHPGPIVRASTCKHSKPFIRRDRSPMTISQYDIRQSYRRCIPVPGKDDVFPKKHALCIALYTRGLGVA